MIWAAWRQQRVVIILFWAAVAALIGYMLVVGFAYEGDYAALLAHHCAGRLTHFCTAHTNALHNDQRQTTYILWVLGILPVIGGVVLGAPLVASELDRKTNRLAWTQGVSRTRWLLWKCGMAAVAVVIAMVAVAEVAAWWLVAVQYTIRIDPSPFDASGMVLIGFALFAFILGVALGAVLRRTLGAAVVTLVGFGLMRWWVETYARPHYIAPLTYRWTVFGYLRGPGTASWWVGSGQMSTRGRSSTWVLRMANQCYRQAYPRACLTAHHIVNFILYQPESRYWPFQWIETGIFMGAALLVLGAAVLAVRRWRA